MLTNKELRKILNCGIALSVEKDKNKLLELLLTEAMELSNCDAGTVYFYNENQLEFRIMKTISLGISKGVDGEKIDLPPVPMTEGNVCAYAALHRELINIPDVYNNERFDFSGPKKYDAMTGYHTKSLLVIPLEDPQAGLAGVLQLINAQDKNGEIVSFNEDDEFVIRALGAMTAISLLNMIYTEEIRKQLHSFVAAFATAVDERTPYNGSHTRKVTAYAGHLAEHMNQLHQKGECEDFFDEDRMEQLQMAAALHDIGKMIIPLGVMDKKTRLEERLDVVKQRFELLHAWTDLCYYKELLDGEKRDVQHQFLTDSLELICQVDGKGFLPDEDLAKIQEIGAYRMLNPMGEEISLLTDEELACLSIRKGTLTEDERKIMESHVVMTDRILSMVHFQKNYNHVREYAASHHELLNGSGYPNHLEGDALSLEARILAVVDVYDALTATDRPYKKPIPKDKAFAILYSMVEEGKLEERLVRYLEESLEGVDVQDLKSLLF